MTPAGFDVARDCIRRLYCGLSPDVRDRSVCVTLEAFQVFADDSYTDEYYVVGGFLAPIGVWETFVPDWYGVLKESPRLGYYTTNDALGLKGPFAGWGEAARNTRMAKLASVIPSEDCWGVAAHLRVSDFNDIFKEAFPEWGNPYYLCADYLVLEVCKFLLFERVVDKVDFIFDRQGKVGKHYRLHYDIAIKPMALGVLPFLGECRHEDKQNFLPLQAADMNAAWVRRREGTIQLWTTADPYLRNLQQFDFKVERLWLEKLAEYQKEHAEEIKAYWDRHAPSE